MATNVIMCKVSKGVFGNGNLFRCNFKSGIIRIIAETRILIEE